jgi:Ferritin-like
MQRERGWPTLALDDDMIETVTTFVLESREQLLNGLAEAAEIEHNLMCCYLYAAFSLKEGSDEDLTELELNAVKRWRYELIHIAVGEMTHLTLVANLMSAIGGVPNLGRGNFPISAGYHPAGIVVKLEPFAPETLDHFIYLERPEGVHIADGAGFEPDQQYGRVASHGRLAPSNGDYATVGALYRAISDGLKCYAARHGEAALFVGDPQQQLGPDVANLPGLVRVRCLETAQAAIEQIVVEGEGSPRQFRALALSTLHVDAARARIVARGSTEFYASATGSAKPGDARAADAARQSVDNGVAGGKLVGPRQRSLRTHAPAADAGLCGDPRRGFSARNGHRGNRAHVRHHPGGQRADSPPCKPRVLANRGHELRRTASKSSIGSGPCR